jgi:hypothetical protein
VLTLFSFWQSNYNGGVNPLLSQQYGAIMRVEDETRASFDNKTLVGNTGIQGCNQSNVRKSTLVFPRGLEASSTNATALVGIVGPSSHEDFAANHFSH